MTGPAGAPTETRAGAPSRAVQALHALVRAGRNTLWFLRGVLGEDAYQHYLAHHARMHPDTEPLSAKAFWKDRMDWQDRNPQGRCC